MRGKVRSVTNALVALFAGLIVLGMPGQGLAQTRTTAPVQGVGRQFDASTITTMTGSITRIESVPHQGRSPGVHLVLNVNGQPVTVALGPSWYVEEQGLKLNPGDTVEVTGSQVTQNGQNVLVATEIHKGGAVMRLRSQSGMPLWSGGRR